MATLDWSQCPAVESIPGKVSGAFGDSRSVQAISIWLLLLWPVSSLGQSEVLLLGALAGCVSARAAAVVTQHLQEETHDLA